MSDSDAKDNTQSSESHDAKNEQPHDVKSAASPVDHRVALSISDACGLVSKIITMNKIALESMRTEINFNKKVAEFRLHENRVVRAKMALINELNDVFEQQLHEFTDARQQQTAELYRKINALDENEESKKMVEELRRLEEIKAALQNQFSQLDAQIPDRRLIVNYKIKQRTNGKTCAAAALEYVGEAEVSDDD